MAKKTYAENIKDAEIMSAGLSNHAEQVSKRGLDETFITEMNADLRDAIMLNNEQEKLKADLKLKTEALAAKMAALNASVAEARKIVKIDFPKAQWKEFGIDATR
jgi:hypothetical protein